MNEKMQPVMIVTMGATATIIYNGEERKQFTPDVKSTKPKGVTDRFGTGFPSLPIQYSERFAAD